MASGIKEAFKAGLLHKDIHMGNVMAIIDEFGNYQGCLLDWEFSEDRSKKKRRSPCFCSVSNTDFAALAALIDPADNMAVHVN